MRKNKNESHNTQSARLVQTMKIQSLCSTQKNNSTTRKRVVIDCKSWTPVCFQEKGGVGFQSRKPCKRVGGGGTRNTHEREANPRHSFDCFRKFVRAFVLHYHALAPTHHIRPWAPHTLYCALCMWWHAFCLLASCFVC